MTVCAERDLAWHIEQAKKDGNVGLIQGFYFDRPMKREAFEEKYVK